MEDGFLKVTHSRAGKLRARCARHVLTRTLFACVASFMVGVLTHPAASSPIESQAKFARAMEAAAIGDWDTAITGLSALERADPTPRVKLELARAYLAVGQARKAYELFRQVHDAPETPVQVRRAILPYMEQAEVMSLRLRWGARIASDSNPSKASDGATVYFNGIPFEYRPPVAGKTAFGVEPWLSAEKMTEGGVTAKARLSSRLFREPGLSSMTGHASVGMTPGGTGGTFVQVAADGRLGGGSDYLMPSVEGWKRYSLNESAEFGYGGQVGFLFSDVDGVSGPYVRPYVFGSAALGGVILYGRASLERMDSENAYYSHLTPRIEAGLNARHGGLDISPRVEVARARFDEVDWFWGIRRTDLTVRPSVAVSHDSFTWKGLKPELDVFYERRSSNVVINEYSQFGASVNLVGKF